MGKITVKDAVALQDSGILSEAAVTEMQDKGLVSKGRTAVKKFFKTADGKIVEPRLYFRGGKDTTPSKKMVSFMEEYDKLINKYTTTK